LDIAEKIQANSYLASGWEYYAAIPIRTFQFSKKYIYFYLNFLSLSGYKKKNTKAKTDTT